MTARYVLLGLARPRTPWFAEVGRWATGGSAPIEFIRCVSREEVAANLASGRAYSALLIDAGSYGLDRDLVDQARTAGAATIVVEDATVRRDWHGLGAGAVLPAEFSRIDLIVTLDGHAQSVDRGSVTIDGTRHNDRAPLEGGEGARVGRWVSVIGAGAGTSVLAMALAQALGDRAAGADGVVLADLALDADQAMLHAAPDIVPGISELVESFRSGAVGSATVRELTFAVDGRNYQLLLGLRRHRDWAALRPRATGAALAGLGAAFSVVVADLDADFEGERDCGSVEIEERNALTRVALGRSDVVVAVGTADLKGLHSLIRLLGRLREFGVPAERVVPVVNRAPRQPRARAEISRAIGSLAAAGSDAVAGPLFVASHRRLDALLRDGTRLPDQLGAALAGAVQACFERTAAIGDAEPEPEAVRPGELGRLLADRAAG